MKPRLKRVAAHPVTWALLLALLWWAFTYWPVPLDPAGVQPGPPGDGWGGTALWDAMVREHLNPFAPGVMESFNAPDGRPVQWQVNLQAWPSTLIYWTTTTITGDADVAHNLYLLLGLTGTAASMTWLVWRFVARDRWIAVLAGFALMLMPLLVIKAAGHTAFAHLGPIVLMIGLLLRCFERPSISRGAVAGAAAFVAMSWSGYHLLLAGVAFATILLGAVVVKLRQGDRRAVLTAAASAVITLLALLTAIAVLLLLVGRGDDPIGSVRSNTIDALTTYGARWYEYFIPGERAALFGGSLTDFWQDRRHGSNGAESTLYLGITVMAAAVVGFVALVRRRQTVGGAPQLDRGLLLVAGPLLAVVALIWSLPPHVYPIGLTLPTPSAFVFEFITTWRVYARFAMVAMIGVVVLAALGLRALAGSGRRRIAVLAVASLVIPLDLSVQSSGPTETTAPPVAQKIAKLPPGTLAIYPLARGEIDGYGSFYNQPAFNRSVLNGFDDLPEEARAAQLANLSDDDTLDDLAALGVRWVMFVHYPDASIALGEDPPRGLKLIATSSYGPYPASVFELTDRANKAVASISDGFAPPEGAPGKQIAWSLSNQGEIEVWGNCRRVCRGTVSAALTSFGAPRRVTATVGGKPIAIRVDGARTTGSFVLDRPRNVRFELAFHRRAVIRLAFSPGATPIQSLVPESPDTRSVSVSISEPEWQSASTSKRSNVRESRR